MAQPMQRWDFENVADRMAYYLNSQGTTWEEWREIIGDTALLESFREEYNEGRIPEDSDYWHK